MEIFNSDISKYIKSKKIFNKFIYLWYNSRLFFIKLSFCMVFLLMKNFILWIFLILVVLFLGLILKVVNNWFLVIVLVLLLLNNLCNFLVFIIFFLFLVVIFV